MSFLRRAISMIFILSALLMHQFIDFIHAEVHETVSFPATVEPPTINIDPLIRKFLFTDEERHILITEISLAIQTWGFFNIINHGISTDLQRQFNFEMRKFFSMPSESKNKVRRAANNSRGFANNELTKQKMDAKEIFDVGHKPHPHLPDADITNIVMDGFNQYPDELPYFRRVINDWYGNCTILSEILTAAIADAYLLSFTDEALKPDVRQIFSRAFLEHTSFLRLNYYPVRHHKAEKSSNTSVDIEPVLGVSRHTDAGFLTILLQDDDADGLEVYSGSRQDFGDGAWVSVRSDSSTLTINTGDMLQVWSNNLFKAPEHRVRKSSIRERYSAPFFYNPSYETIISPILYSHNISCKHKYNPINWGEFRRRRFEGDYANKGKEVQIEDYRIKSSQIEVILPLEKININDEIKQNEL